MVTTGRVFEYGVGEYHLRVSFKSETSLHWEYLKAPGNDTGKNATETITRTDLRDDAILMSWQEASGVYVIDVLDLGKMQLHYNFVTPSHEYFAGVADITEVTDKVG